MPQILEKDAFLLRTFVGTADGRGREFELSLINGVVPAVKDTATGKTCVLDWEWLIERAIELGLNKES